MQHATFHSQHYEKLTTAHFRHESCAAGRVLRDMTHIMRLLWCNVICVNKLIHFILVYSKRSANYRTGLIFCVAFVLDHVSTWFQLICVKHSLWFSLFWSLISGCLFIRRHPTLLTPTRFIGGGLYSFLCESIGETISMFKKLWLTWCSSKTGKQNVKVFVESKGYPTSKTDEYQNKRSNPFWLHFI
jgi:hypothetical protein